MNKRQKYVQEAYLDNEEVVMGRLEGVYSRAQRDIELKTRSLQGRINDLQARIDAEPDAERREILKSMQQSKVYQLNYQEALKKQIDGILDNMHVESYKTVDDYLNGCYEEAFLGTMYDLHGQGIPLIMPLDQAAMVRAVQLDPKISKDLYTHMGEDVQQLKKDIAAEVSRGISTGASFEQIAQQIGFKMMGKYDAPGGSLARAMTIARTEGHRIQNQSTMDTCYKAREKGADVVKQWDSTQDKSTRKSHQIVDGETRELDERFSNGLMYPGDPDGGAAEVVNCRCALLQRARWAMNAEELETQKKRAEYYGLDKSDTFKDFKKKYMKATETERIFNESAPAKPAQVFASDNATLAGYDKIKGKHSCGDDLKAVNPNGYTDNCQQCCVAYEARRRGYDVFAQDTQGQRYLFEDAFEGGSGGRIHLWKGISEMKVPISEIKQRLEDKMLGFGDGSRAIISTHWDYNNSAHVFIAENHNGKVVYYDPQSGNANYADVWYRMHKNTSLIRIDNRPFTKHAREAVTDK